MFEEQEQEFGESWPVDANEPTPQATAPGFTGSYLELVFGTIDHAARARAAAD